MGSAAGVRGTRIAFKEYLVPFQIKEELCSHYLHKVMLVPSAG